MYKVLEYFEDLQDENYKYNPGDTYPREGLKVSKSRMDSLESGKNKRKLKLIEKVEDVEDEPEIKPTRTRKK